MPLFAPQGVKDLKNQAGEIGSLIGQAGTGLLPAADVADVISSDERRNRLRAAFDAASKEVGDDKALKTAVKAP